MTFLSADNWTTRLVDLNGELVNLYSEVRADFKPFYLII